MDEPEQGAGERKRSSSLALGTLAIEAEARGQSFAWLDGGHAARSFFALHADAQVECDEFAAIDQVDALWKASRSQVWMGWMSYDLGADHLLGRPATRGRLAGLVARRYASTCEFETRPGRGASERLAAARWHGGAGATARLRASMQGAIRDESAPSSSPRRWPFGALRAEHAAPMYRQLVARAIEFIRAGDTYQVNLSQEMRATFREPRPRSAVELAAAAVDTFARLREATPASMGALIRAQAGQWIVSNSPETLLDWRIGSGSLATWPIKGTRARGGDEASDAAAAAELLESAKDLAEHVMIVDLVRNDLGRLARPGTVQVDGPPSLVSLPTVHHLVTRVSAQVDPRWGLRQILEALFPGGSITGAPKRRSVEIIDGLEGAPRSIYCGAIFVLEPEGMRVSIPIRTAIVSNEGLWLRSGGGVVVDSDPEAERRETLAKARAFEPDPRVG